MACVPVSRLQEEETHQMGKAMNDKELADRIVALGVGRPCELDVDGLGDIGNWTDLNDYEFVRDWRVAGALMEKCKYTHGGYWFGVVWDQAGLTHTDESLPRAICEACVEALS
jgi:hypothetical protein